MFRALYARLAAAARRAAHAALSAAADGVDEVWGPLPAMPLRVLAERVRGGGPDLTRLRYLRGWALARCEAHG